MMTVMLRLSKHDERKFVFKLHPRLNDEVGQASRALSLPAGRLRVTSRFITRRDLGLNILLGVPIPNLMELRYAMNYICKN